MLYDPKYMDYDLYYISSLYVYFISYLLKFSQDHIFYYPHATPLWLYAGYKKNWQVTVHTMYNDVHT